MALAQRCHHAGGRGGGGPGPGQAVLRGQDRWQADTASLTLQPAWPGGRQPVSLRYDLSLPQAADGAPTEGPPRGWRALANCCCR
jgi:hypothetical protein